MFTNGLREINFKKMLSVSDARKLRIYDKLCVVYSLNIMYWVTRRNNCGDKTKNIIQLKPITNELNLSSDNQCLVRYLTIIEQKKDSLVSIIICSNSFFENRPTHGQGEFRYFAFAGKIILEIDNPLSWIFNICNIPDLIIMLGVKKAFGYI